MNLSVPKYIPLRATFSAAAVYLILDLLYKLHLVIVVIDCPATIPSRPPVALSRWLDGGCGCGAIREVFVLPLVRLSEAPRRTR